MENAKSLKDNPEFIKDLETARREIAKLKELQDNLWNALCKKHNINKKPNSDIVWDYVFNDYDCLKLLN